MFPKIQRCEFQNISLNQTICVGRANTVFLYYLYIHIFVILLKKKYLYLGLLKKNLYKVFYSYVDLKVEE